MRSTITGAIILALSTFTLAHPGHDEPDSDGAVSTQIVQALDKNRVQITERDGFRHIDANGIPDHPTGRFPNRGNPNSISAQNYAFKVPLKPVEAEQRVPARRTLFGVAVNGVVFDPGTAEWWRNDPQLGWNHEAIGGSLNLGIDPSNAHVQPSGAYHYHGLPLGLIKNLQTGKKRPQMTLVGWAADGYPVYASFGHADPDDAKSDLKKLSPSYRLKEGTRPAGDDGPGGTYDGAFTRDFEYVPNLGDLDECNGRTGVTPEFPNGTYHYVLTDTFPYIPRFLHGTPDPSFERKGGPPPGGRRRPPPPPGA